MLGSTRGGGLDYSLKRRDAVMSGNTKVSENSAA